MCVPTDEAAIAETPREPGASLGNDGNSSEPPVGHAPDFGIKMFIKPQSRNRLKKARRIRYRGHHGAVQSTAKPDAEDERRTARHLQTLREEAVSIVEQNKIKYEKCVVDAQAQLKKLATLKDLDDDKVPVGRKDGANIMDLINSALKARKGKEVPMGGINMLNQTQRANL